MRTIVTVMLLLLAAAQARAQDIVVGAGFGLSGRFATYGEDAKAGVDLAVKRINDAGGVLGRPLRVEYQDTGADRAKSVAVYRRFAAQPQVVTLLSLSSIEFSALDAIAPDVRLPIISVGSAAPVARFSPWSFRDRDAIRVALGQTKGLSGVDGTFTYAGSGDNTVQVPYLFSLVNGQYQRLR